MNEEHRFDGKAYRVYQGSFDLFERYWVLGQRQAEIAEAYGVTTTTVGYQMTERGIPRRRPSDSHKLRDGELSLDRLRWKYLTPFQHALALDLESWMRSERVDNSFDAGE